MVDCIIVGGGIIGATIAKALDRQNCQTQLIDSNESMAGTKASGGHLKPSWFSGMKKEEYEPAMVTLSECWYLFEETFKIYPVGHTTVYRVDTDSVLRRSKRLGTVNHIRQEEKFPVVEWTDELSDDRVSRCKLLIICAGVWCDQLIPEIKIKRKMGVSFRFSGPLDYPFIKVWAPYKQIVAHQQNRNRIWIGDGSAILEKNWTADRTRQCLARCKKALNKECKVRRIIPGLRPYCETNGDPCLFKKVGPSTYCVTGAGKLGTLAAGWAARRIIDEVL